MGENTKIEWTDSSWTPIRARNLLTGKIGWHCEHASDGCRFCYAEGMNHRLGTGLPFKPGHRKDIDVFLDEKMLMAPLRWRRPRMIFVCSMTDIFAEFVKDEWIDKMLAVMATCTQHTFQILTKRADRMLTYIEQFDWRGHYVCSNTRDQIGPDLRDGNRLLLLSEGQAWPLRNVWLGVSAEDQERADERIPLLLQTPAAVRFLSAEPLLGPIDLFRAREPTGFTFNALSKKEGIAFRGLGIDWVIAGSESGNNARACALSWVRGIRDQCQSASVPFFWKQHIINGRKIGTPELDGKRWVDLPLLANVS